VGAGVGKGVFVAFGVGDTNGSGDIVTNSR
jgi:hypothetical protein